MAKAERKYLAHFIDSKFGDETGPTYVRLGKDLEEYAIELNPDVETKKNILGENSVAVNGYEASSSVDPYYYEYDDTLSKKIWDIGMNRTTGDGCKTTVVDVLLKADGTVLEAWREDAYVVPESIGGDTSGVQMPFTIHRAGNRKKGTFVLGDNTFTEGES
jgi:hypothetical protein